MKLAVGIIGIFLSLLALLQSVIALNGGKEVAVLVLLTGLLMFFGAAFAFQLPRLAQVFFVAGALFGWPAKAQFPDAAIWAGACLVLAILLFFERKTHAPPPKPPQ